MRPAEVSGEHHHEVTLYVERKPDVTKGAWMYDDKNDPKVYLSFGCIKFLIPVVTLCIFRFDIKNFYVLPTQHIYVFCVNLKTKSD
jgi:hypothetical protein